MTDVIYKSWAEGSRPEQPLILHEWADQFRMLPRESSKEPGRYRTSRTPYLKEPMERLSPSNPCQYVVVIKGTQLGWTTIAENLLFMVADKALGPCLALFPTGDLLERFSKNRITTALKEMDCLAGKIKNSRERDSGNTVKLKKFPGGYWRFATSNSGAALRSDPIRFLILDDRDGFDININGEGEPGELAKKRTDTFSSTKKIYENSTPTDEETSRIQKSFNRSSQAYYHVPCPHCGHIQPLKWRLVKYDQNNISKTIRYECEACHKGIREYYKSDMLSMGKWIHKKPENPVKGYHLNSLYSPVGWVSWAQIAQEYEDAMEAMKKKDVSLMKVFKNTRLAETWKEKLEGIETKTLYDRREDYGPEVPEGGLVLTCGVDVQGNRLELEVMAWGIGGENWGIEYEIIEGNPEDPETWNTLEKYINQPFRHESGATLRIQAVAVDCGYMTDEVYKFCGPRWPRVFSVKGYDPKSGGGRGARPIIPKKPTVDNPYKARRFSVGTDTAKDLWARWLTVTSPGPKCCHFPAYYTPEFFGMITAEKVATRYLNGYAVKYWVKISNHARNEALDIRVYNLAAITFLKPNYQAVARKLRNFSGKKEIREVAEEIRKPDPEIRTPDPVLRRKRRKAHRPWM